MKFSLRSAALSLSFTLAAFLSVGLPWVAAQAQSTTQDQAGQTVNIYNPLTGQQGGASGSISGQPSTTSDPISDAQIYLGRLLGTIFKGLAALSLIPIVVGGMQMIISQGNDEMVSRGKNTVYYGIIGLFLSLAAVGVFTTVVNFILGPK